MHSRRNCTVGTTTSIELVESRDCNYSSLDIERERCESRQKNRAIVSGGDDDINRVRA
jgi:hypothetical protein